MPEDIADWLDYPFLSGMHKEVRPKVRELLIDMFSDYERYDEYVVDGGIGIGKSFLSGVGVAYGVHTLSCLKDPRGHFKLGGGTIVPIAFMNMSDNLVRLDQKETVELMYRSLDRLSEQDKVEVLALARKLIENIHKIDPNVKFGEQAALEVIMALGQGIAENRLKLR